MTPETENGLPSPDIEQIIGSMPLDQQRDLRRRIGKMLGRERKKQHVPQEEAAKLIGLSRTHLSNVEVGRSRPGWEGIQKMALVYSYDIQKLIQDAKAAQAADPLRIDRFMPEMPINEPHPTIIQYSADNLGNYEKSVMRDFHLLDADDRAELMEKIRLKIQRRLQTTDAT